MRFNLYYNFPGPDGVIGSRCIEDVSLESASGWVVILLNHKGYEITGIINVEDDQ